jgi:hypothetical protein
MSGILHIPEEGDVGYTVVKPWNYTQYICVGRLICVVSRDMKKFKSRKPSSLVSCPSGDAGTNLHLSLITFNFYSCTSLFWVQYIHISSKKWNCLCHVILFINFCHFYKIKLYIQAFYILHYLCISACNGWEQT